MSKRTPPSKQTGNEIVGIQASAAESATEYITPSELEQRWRGTISLGTLANWRAKGDGPAFRKIGGRVLYLLASVEHYERRRTRGET